MLQCIPKNIIIRMPNWIVDFVMATTILPEIRKKFPSAKITAMCKDPLGSLLQKDPNIDELFCFHKPTKNLFQRKERKSIIEKLKMGQYRSEERRVGKECSEPCRTLWEAYQ